MTTYHEPPLQSRRARVQSRSAISGFVIKPEPEASGMAMLGGKETGRMLYFVENLIAFAKFLCLY